MTSERHRPAFPSNRLALLILVVVYVPMSLAFSLLTRQWEAPDAASHVYNVEYIVRHDGFPRISAANFLESDQPPLYYLFEDGSQRVLGIPAFTPVVVPAKTPPKSFGINHLIYSADYRADNGTTKKSECMSCGFPPWCSGWERFFSRMPRPGSSG